MDHETELRSQAEALVPDHATVTIEQENDFVEVTASYTVAGDSGSRSFTLVTEMADDRFRDISARLMGEMGGRIRSYEYLGSTESSK